MGTISLTFPDSSYTSANKPSVATLKADLATIETGHNDLESHAIKDTDTTIDTAGFFLDEDNMASNSEKKIPSQQSVKAYVDAQISSAIATTKSALFPIGSIFTSVVSTNPATLLGFGTWTAFGAGKTLVGLDSGDTAFNTVEETGGAKTTSIAHTHSTPSHTHHVYGNTGGASAVAGWAAFDNGSADRGHIHGVDIWTESGGNGTSGAMSANSTPSVLQPYVVVYFWKRVA